MDEGVGCAFGAAWEQKLKYTIIARWDVQEEWIEEVWRLRGGVAHVARRASVDDHQWPLKSDRPAKRRRAKQVVLILFILLLKGTNVNLLYKTQIDSYHRSRGTANRDAQYLIV